MWKPNIQKDFLNKIPNAQTIKEKKKKLISIKFNVSFYQGILWIKPLVKGSFKCIELTTDPGLKNIYKVGKNKQTHTNKLVMLKS